MSSDESEKSDLKASAGMEYGTLAGLADRLLCSFPDLRRLVTAQWVVARKGREELSVPNTKQGQAGLRSHPNRLSRLMGIFVRRAELAKDRLLLIEFISRFLSADASADRFDWLYCRNPGGIAKVWVAAESGCEEPVGVAAAFPRPMVQGKGTKSYVLGDFCMRPDHRSLGPALALQNACIQGLSSEHADFAFDFPSHSMTAIYHRLQIVPCSRMVRWAKPLRADREIGKRLKSSALARVFAPPVNALLAWKDAVSSKPKGECQISEFQGRCDEEFTALGRKLLARGASCLERSADYLNWRYLQHPIRQYRMLTARSGGELQGYLVFFSKGTGEDASIVDWCATDNSLVLTSLLQHAVALLREQRVMTISIALQDNHPQCPLLAEAGFRPRESQPIIVLDLKQGSAGPLNRNYPWNFMDGDRES